MSVSGSKGYNALINSRSKKFIIAYFIFFILISLSFFPNIIGLSFTSASVNSYGVITYYDQVVYWSADFEEGDESDWSRDGGGFVSVRGIPGNSLTYVSSNPTPFKGDYCMKSYTPSSNPSFPWDEVRHARGARWRETTSLVDAYYGGAVYFPPSFKLTDARDWCNIVSLRVHESSLKPDSQFMMLSMLPNRELGLRRSWNDVTEWYYPRITITDGWHVFIIHLKTGSNGLFELWWDSFEGNPLFRLEGDFNSKANPAYPGPKIQVGLYRGNLDPNENWLAFDNIIVASTLVKAQDFLT
jgi:hypothetical protein